jgi:hypothetical protein
MYGKLRINSLDFKERCKSLRGAHKQTVTAVYDVYDCARRPTDFIAVKKAKHPRRLTKE